jgi:hypothetical protein
VGSGQWSVGGWLTRSREGRPQGVVGVFRVAVPSAGRTEYEYEVRTLGDHVFGFFVLVLVLSLEFCTLRSRFARWRLRSSGFPARALCCEALPVLAA